MRFCSWMQLLFNKLIPGSACSSKAHLVFSGNLEEKKNNKTNQDILLQVASEYVAADHDGTICLSVWEPHRFIRKLQG